MTQPKTISVLIAEDHKLVRTGFIKLIEEAPELFVIADVEDGNALVKAYFEKLPDIVVSDISMPLLSGFDAAKKIISNDRGARILFLSMFDTDEYIYRAYKIGAKGLLSKNINSGELNLAIRKVLSGSLYFGKWNESNIDELLFRFESISKVNNTSAKFNLTTREKQFIRLIAEGLTNQEIADRLDIAKKTVDNIRLMTMKKLNINSLPALMKLAL
ncbi:MAG: DNA-binding response regulator, partial [Ignavibacteriales bacterium]